MSPELARHWVFYARMLWERADMDTAYTLAKINFEMTKLFGIQEGITYPDMIKVLASQGDKQNALNYLEAYAQSILELSYDYSNNPVFNRLTEQPSDTSYIKKILAQSILADQEYTPLKDEPRYLQVISRLREVADVQTHAFSKLDTLINKMDNLPDGI